MYVQRKDDILNLTIIKFKVIVRRKKKGLKGGTIRTIRKNPLEHLGSNEASKIVGSVSPFKTAAVFFWP
jgi:hypothetical protein